MSATLDKSVTSTAMFGVFRHQRDGLVDDETRRRMRLIVPHIRRAVLIDRAIDLNTAEAATFADALDGLMAGMFLVDETGRVVNANVSGHAMLKQGSVLGAPGGKLAANAPNAAQALNEISARAGGGDVAVGVKGIAVALADRDGECYVAHVLPLTSGARRRAGASNLAVAALFVRKAALEARSPPETAEALASPSRRSRRICTVCSVRPAQAASPSSSSWWPGSPIPSSAEQILAR